LAIILVLCVACYFLFRSMSKHLKKVREQAVRQTSPDDQPDPAHAVSRDGGPDAPPHVEHNDD